MTAPSVNGLIGRNARGRFAHGNAGGPGNPAARQVMRLRHALLDAITEEDLGAIVAKLLEMAKAGNMAAIREVLDRTLGKPLLALAVGLTDADEACNPLTPTLEERRAAIIELCEGYRTIGGHEGHHRGYADRYHVEVRNDPRRQKGM